MNKIINKIFGGATFGFFVAIIVALISSVNTALYISKMKNDLQVMYEQDLMGQNKIQIARINLIYLDREIREYILQEDAEDKKRSLLNINHYRQGLNDNIIKAKPLYYTKRNKELFSSMEKTLADYISILDQNLNKIEKYRSEIIGSRIEKIDNEMRVNFNKLDTILNRLDDIKQQKDIRTYKSILLQNDTTLALTFAVLFITITIRLIVYINTKKAAVQKIADKSKKKHPFSTQDG